MQKIVLGLVQVVLGQALGEAALAKTSLLESTSAVLLKKIQAMPVWLKFPIVILTFLFNMIGIFSTGCLFEAQSFSRQVKTVGAWQGSPIKLCREFIKFYEKLALFIYYSL